MGQLGQARTTMALVPIICPGFCDRPHAHQPLLFAHCSNAVMSRLPAEQKLKYHFSRSRVPALHAWAVLSIQFLAVLSAKSIRMPVRLPDTLLYKIQPKENALNLQPQTYRASTVMFDIATAHWYKQQSLLLVQSSPYALTPSSQT